MDYPDIAGAVGVAVARREADAGIVIDGAGIGSAIAANKVRGVRAAMCPDETIARYSREHNGANVLTLGATLLPGTEAALSHRRLWLGTPMREARYIRRLLKIRRLEERPMLNPHDLQRLVEIITEEVLAAQGAGGAAGPVRLPRRAVGLLPGPAARRARRRGDAARPSRDRRRAGRRVAA